MQYGRRWAKSNDLRERWERGGASVHSYRSLHKLYRFTNYNRLYSIESSHECPPDAVSSDGCPVTSWRGVFHLGPGHRRVSPRGRVPAGWRGVLIVMSDSWGSCLSHGWRGVLLDWVWRRRGVIDTCHVERIFDTLTLEGLGVPCLTGIVDVDWVFLWLSILTLAGPDPSLHVDFSVCWGGSNFRDLMFILPYYLLVFEIIL